MSCFAFQCGLPVQQDQHETHFVVLISRRTVFLRFSFALFLFTGVLYHSFCHKSITFTRELRKWLQT